MALVDEMHRARRIDDSPGALHICTEASLLIIAHVREMQLCQCPLPAASLHRRRESPNAPVLSALRPRGCRPEQFRRRFTIVAVCIFAAARGGSALDAVVASAARDRHSPGRLQASARPPPSHTTRDTLGPPPDPLKSINTMTSIARTFGGD
ncbi:hypothetical protein PSPO01_08969 [Paraphaeosphaeria sporulosa]